MSLNLMPRTVVVLSIYPLVIPTTPRETGTINSLYIVGGN